MGRECDQSGNEQDAGPGNVIAANNAQTIASALCDAPSCTKAPGAGVTVYYYDGEGHRVEQIDPVTGTTVFVYDALTPMPVDDEGTTRLFTDSAGNVVERHDFDPFGHELMGTEDPDAVKSLEGSHAWSCATGAIRAFWTGWFGGC